MGVQLQSHKDHWSLCCPRAFIRFVKTKKPHQLEQFFNRVSKVIRLLCWFSTSSRETLRFSENKIHCSPRDQSLSVNCHIFGH